MANVFTRKEVDKMIEAAVAKATGPLLERIATLEAELAAARKNSSTSSKPPSSPCLTTVGQDFGQSAVFYGV